MSNEKKNLLIVISSIFNFLMILILAFFYFQLKKKSNNLKKISDDLQKNIEDIKSDKFSTENEVHEKKEQILEKLEKEIKQQEDFFKTFYKQTDITEQFYKIKKQIIDVKDTFEINKQDKKTKDTFEKYIKYFKDISESGVDPNEKSTLKEIVKYMYKFLQMCEEERDTRILALAHKFDNEKVKDDLQILRKYLNGYAFLLDLRLEKIEQITNLINSSSSKIEKDKLTDLKYIIQKKYKDFLLKSIQSAVTDSPQLIQNLLKSN